MSTGRSCRVGLRVFLVMLRPTKRRYASLATETEYVRSRLAEYGNDLISLGVDGLRLDAAKRSIILSFSKSLDIH